MPEPDPAERTFVVQLAGWLSSDSTTKDRIGGPSVAKPPATGFRRPVQLAVALGPTWRAFGVGKATPTAVVFGAFRRQYTYAVRPIVPLGGPGSTARTETRHALVPIIRDS